MNLCQLIQDTENQNNQTRANAEQQLLDARTQNPDLFALTCSEEFKGNQLPKQLKPKAGILIKYTLLASSTGPEVFWQILNPNTRQQIKDNLLEMFAETDDGIRNVTADLTSLIYVIEFSWNGWPTLFPILTQNLTSQDEALKKASIAVLSKICDQVKSRKVTLSQDIVNLILDALIQCTRENISDDKIKILVLNTFDSSLPFFREIFDTQSGIRNEVLKFLLDANRSNNQRVKMSAIQSLISFVTVPSHYLKECWYDIWEATSTEISGDTQEFAIVAIEVWQAIIERDKQRVPQEKILNEVSQRLVPVLFENLLDEQKSQDDEEMGGEYGEPTTFSATRACLTSLAQAMNETFSGYAVAFIKKYLWSENQIESKAGLIVYSCMLDGANPQYLATFISEALPTIADILFKNENLVLKKEASLALQKTAEIIPERLFQGNYIDSILKDLIASIPAPSSISVNIAKFWQNFCQFCDKNNKDFSPDFKVAIENLIGNIFGELDYEDYPLIEPSLVAAGTLISCLSQQEVQIEYINSLLEKIKKQSGWNEQRTQLTHAGLLSCIGITLEKCQLGSEDPLISNIFSLLDQISEVQDQIPAEGIRLLEGLISALGPESTATHFEKIWVWILKAFDFIDDPMAFTASLKAIPKLIQICPAQTKNALEHIFQSLFTAMNHSGSEDPVKAEIVKFVGDLAGTLKGEVLMHIEKAMQIYNAAIGLVTLSSVRDGVPGAIKLEENLVKSYRTFFKVVAESENPYLILESVPNMMQYLMITCSESWNPSMEYIRDVLDLVFEVALRWKDQGIENVKSEVVVSLIEKLNQFPDDPRNKEIIDSAKKNL